MKTDIVPVTIVDDFFEYPELWVDMASKCKYGADPIGKWPGKRSDTLSDIYPEAYEMLCRRFFSLFYDLKMQRIGFKVDAYFHKIPPRYTEGWTHYDPKMISGIIYLSPDADINAGTSLYRPNKIARMINVDSKLDEYTDRKTSEEVSKFKEENNNQFTELVRIQNVFNRMIAFDCNIAHRAHFGNQNFERTTLVFFVSKLDAEKTPIRRMRENV